MPVTLLLTKSRTFSPLVVENTTLKLEDQFDNGAIFETFSRILDEVFFGQLLQLPILEIGDHYVAILYRSDFLLISIQIQPALTRFGRTK